MLQPSFISFVNVERQHCIFIEPWSNSIHIALWRNDGFLHSFRDFSKSNASNENLIRMKFILHKFSFKWVYFRAAKPGGCSSIYIKKWTSIFSAYNNYYCHDTGRSFEPICMKFTWLARVYARMSSIFFFFETIGPIEPLIWRKCAPFGFHSAGMGVSRKKF